MRCLDFWVLASGASSLPICSCMSGHRSNMDWMCVIVGLSLFKILKSPHNIFKFFGKNRIDSENIDKKTRRFLCFVVMWF